MEDFLKQLLEKLLSYFLFLFVIMFISACLMTGEFPPRFQSVKAKYQSFIELKDNYTAMMKKANDRMNAPPEMATAGLKPTPGIEAQAAQEFEENIKQLRVDQARIQSQLEYIRLQNQEILKRLSTAR